MRSRFSIYRQSNKQVEYEYGDLQIFRIGSEKDAVAAITRIQGEGSSKFPFVEPGSRLLAHFYRFGELYFRRHFVYDPTAQTGDWTVTPVYLPDFYPMTPVPCDGFGADAPSEVGEFDRLLRKY
jgi:hypothetical protein